jgi:hypothetical protein
MSKLISIQGYIKQNFDPDGAPSPITVRRWCKNGHLPAEKRGGSWYIHQKDEIQTADNPLVNMVLAG